jgi:hypothetical protein
MLGGREPHRTDLILACATQAARRLREVAGVDGNVQDPRQNAIRLCSRVLAEAVRRELPELRLHRHRRDLQIGRG